jgi:DNA polymerase III epsilon subunit family exonuclease
LMLDAICEQIGLNTPLAAPWLEPRLDGRFEVSDGAVGLRSWTRGFPPSGEAIVALDLEATNGDPVREDIIEIGAVRIDQHGLREFQAFAMPTRPVNPFVQRLTGITMSMLEGAPPLEQTLTKLETFMAGATLVVHNAGFDAALLTREFGKLGRTLPNPVVDTVNLAQVALPGRRKRGLETLAKLYNLPQLSKHRALEDARLTLSVAKELYFTLAGSRELTLKDLHDEFNSKPIKPQPGPVKATSPQSSNNGVSGTSTKRSRRRRKPRER